MTQAASRNEILAALAIRSAAGIGAILGNRLIQAFGSAADVLAASDAELATIEGMRPQVLASLRQDLSRPQNEALLDLCQERNVRVLVPGSPDYPPALLPLADRPLVLFARGACVWPERAIALVGTRLPSVAGLKLSREFARFFAVRGIAVVSGLARGIDTSAHEGALENGGLTIAVVGSGLDALYPPENRALAASIEERGTVLSEYGPDEEAQAFHFPVRNRIISGLAAGVVVVEAPRKSGALGTADWALDHGRDVMAVPASPYTRSALGGLDLIKKGAACVTSPEDVMEVLGWEALPARETRGLGLKTPVLGIEQQSLLDLFLPGQPVTADQLSARVDWEAPRLLEALSELELRGMIASLPGQRWCLR